MKKIYKKIKKTWAGIQNLIKNEEFSENFLV
jgi:hypothetical protein